MQYGQREIRSEIPIYAKPLMGFHAGFRHKSEALRLRSADQIRSLCPKILKPNT